MTTNYEFWLSPDSIPMVTNCSTGFSGVLQCDHKSIEIIYNSVYEKYPEAFKTLERIYKGHKYGMVRHFVCCNFGEHDSKPDLLQDGTMCLENVKCPQKARCEHRNVICNPKRKIFTPREEQVKSLVQKGLSSKKIAKELNISENTVKVHKRNMLAKTGASNTIHMLTL